MSMNMPPEQQPMEQPPVDTTATPEAPTMEQPVAEQAPVEPQMQEQEVVENIAEGLANEEISARDIMTAVLSDTLGLSPNTANALVDLLQADLIDEAVNEETTMEQMPDGEQQQQ